MIDLRILTKTWNDKPAAVFGLARSGLSAIKALNAVGIDVIAWDDKQDAREKAAALGAEIKELNEDILKDCAALILAPGVPLYFPEPHPVVKAARVSGTEIICDIELLSRLDHGCRTIGITGTNGKSTTTALTEHILKTCGLSVSCGGNIGKAVCDLEMPEKNGVFLFELSSYQLDLCPTFSPDIAVLLNVSPDHLDRHGSMENYVAAKENIFRSAAVKIIGTDDQISKDLCAKHSAIPISGSDVVKGVDNPNLRGEHNAQNIAAAVQIAKALGLEEAQIIEAINSFSGLAHRQFLVRQIAGILYVNDSKATNAEATGKALKSFDDIYWIAGGQAKDGGLAGLEDLLPHVRHSYLIGEAADDFANWHETQNVLYTKCETLDAATKLAHAAAQKAGKGVVLLSPACASFDQFKSFEHRGDEFVRLVEAL